MYIFNTDQFDEDTIPAEKEGYYTVKVIDLYLENGYVKYTQRWDFVKKGEEKNESTAD